MTIRAMAQKLPLCTTVTLRMLRRMLGELLISLMEAGDTGPATGVRLARNVLDQVLKGVGPEETAPAFDA